VRKGQLEAAATIASPRVERHEGRALLVLDMTHSGPRSVYGELIVRPRRGGGDPLYTARGIAIYPEVSQRRLQLQLSDEQAAKLRGPLRFEYREPANAERTDRLCRCDHRVSRGKPAENPMRATS